MKCGMVVVQTNKCVAVFVSRLNCNTSHTGGLSEVKTNSDTFHAHLQQIPLCTVAFAATLGFYSKSYIYQLIYSGKITAFTAGNIMLVDIQSLKNYAESKV